MAALYAIAFLSSLGFSIVVPFLVFLVIRLGGNGFVLGAIGASFWAAQLVGASWLGALSDRVGRKRILFRSQLGAMAAWLILLVGLWVPPVVLARVTTSITGAFTLSLPLVLLAVARMTDGLFNGSISVANAYMADVTKDDDRKIGFARLGVANNLGFVLGPSIAGLLARSDTGIIAVVLLALALSATAAALVHFRLPEVPPRPTTPLKVTRAGGVKVHKMLGGGCPDHVARPPGRLRTVLSIGELRPMVAIYFFVFLAFSTFTAALPIHAAQDLGWSSARLGIFFTTLAVALVVTESLVLPAVVHRIPSWILGAGGSAIVAVGYVLMSTHAAPALFAGAVLYGVGNGLSWPAYLALLSGKGPRELQGTVQGVGSSAGSLASIIGTLASGILIESIGAATLYVSAIAVACAGTLFVVAAGSKDSAHRGQLRASGVGSSALDTRTS